MPEVCAVDPANEDVGRQHDEGDDGEPPACMHHEDQDHHGLSQGADDDVDVQADLISHGRCVRCQPAGYLPCTQHLSRIPHFQEKACK